MNSGQTRNIRLLISYDGTDFSGWQRQAGEGEDRDRTVQGEIEKALEIIHRKKIRLTGSGRTDAGVHAAGQTANFYTDIESMGADRFVPALNSLLPRDLRILEAGEAAPDFHARFDARIRTYRYFFICGRDALPAERRYCLRLWRRPRLDILNSYGRELLGERDCTVFAGAGDKSRSRSRDIRAARFFIEGDKLVFEASANAFLWKMVRSMAGTMLHYEEKGTTPEEFRAIAGSGDRSLAGPTLPPEGLFLWNIDYGRRAEDSR
jgi:tRNA pseudouridine38-40 synthase